MKYLLQSMLARLAKEVVAKYKPTVVAVTGSVGKTSTRNAIVAVLSEKFRVRTTIENYNNEFGVPLTIFGEVSPGRSPVGWMNVLWRARQLLDKTDPAYPNMLVLEYGVDHPGDMKALCEIAKPDVAVLTAISPVHVENFGSLEALQKEKGMLLELVKPEGRSIVNEDDARVTELAGRSKAPVRTYGFAATADIRGEDYRLNTRTDFSFEPGELFGEGQFEVVIDEAREPVVLPDLLGMSQASAALAAIAVGLHFGLSLPNAARAVEKTEPYAGRMRPIPGIKGSLLLDDTYNAAPASMAAALKVLASFSPVAPARRIAALGHMAELGPYNEAEHRELGKKAADVADLLVTVGEISRDTRRGALEVGMPEEKTQHFNTPEEAGRWLDAQVKKGDIVLVKGSQSARMEKVVKDLMAQPDRASELLVRQKGKWLKD